MRKFLLFFALALCTTLYAQIGNGFYRVHNVGTKRYAYVYDNTGGINISTTSADMGAIQLWKDHNRTISDPASVIYIENQGGTVYNLKSQGTSVHEIIGYYVNIYPKGDAYQLYASSGGLTKYLADDEEANVPDGQLGTISKGDYRKWIVTPIDTETNYFGVCPNQIVGNKKYKAFFADFGFSFVNQGMKAYYISEIYKHIAVIKEIKENIVAANTPVIIECVSDAANGNKLNLHYTGGVTPTDNLLKGVYFNNERRPKSPAARTKYDGNTMRILGVTSEGKLGLVTSTEQYLAANESYLVVPTDSPAELTIMTEEELAAYKNSENSGDQGGDDNNGDDSGSGDQGGDNTGDDSGSGDQGGDNTGDDSGNGDQGGDDNNGDDSGNGDQGGDNTGDDSGSGDQGGDNTGDDSGSGDQGGDNTGDDSGNGEENGNDIDSIKTNVKQLGVYSITGKKIADKMHDKLPKGIYIVNGKKVIKL